MLLALRDIQLRSTRIVGVDLREHTRHNKVRDTCGTGRERAYQFVGYCRLKRYTVFDLVLANNDLWYIWLLRLRV